MSDRERCHLNKWSGFYSVLKKIPAKESRKNECVNSDGLLKWEFAIIIHSVPAEAAEGTVNA